MDIVKEHLVILSVHLVRMSIRCSSGVVNRSNNESFVSSPDVEDVAYRGRVMLGVTVAALLLLVSGLVFNCLVFVIFHVFNRKRSYITISNRFVLNLSASNALMSAAVLPAILYSVLVADGGGTGVAGGLVKFGGIMGMEGFGEVGVVGGTGREETGEGGVGDRIEEVDGVREFSGFKGVQGEEGLGGVGGIEVGGLGLIGGVGRGVEIGRGAIEISEEDEEENEGDLRLGLVEEDGIEDEEDTVTREWTEDMDWTGPFGFATCNAIALLTLTSISASIFAVLLISIDRFYAVSRPLHYTRHVTSSKAWAMITGSWLASLFLGSLPLLGWGRVRYDPDKHLCLPHWAGHSWPDKSLAFVVVVVCFVVPLLVMALVYVSVIRAARRTAAQARRNSSTSGMSDPLAVNPRQSLDAMTLASSHRNLVRRRSSAGSCAAPVFYKEDWKAAKTGVVVMTTFVVCWLPFFTNVFMDTLSGCQNSTRHLGVIFVLLAVSSCIVNPLVYVYRTKSVRKQMLFACLSRGQGDAMVVLSSAAEGRRFSQPTNYSMAISANARTNVGQSSTPPKHNIS